MSTKNRKDIFKLTDDELLALRTAYEGIMALPDSDPNSYNYLAAIHGGGNPAIGSRNGYCVHNDPNGSGFGFICWHRIYIQKFEKALQTIVPGIKLPYWDWFTLDESGHYEFPKSFTDETYVDKQGKTKPNPLKSARGRDGNTKRKPKLIEDNTQDFNDLMDCVAAQKQNWSLAILEHPDSENDGFDEATRQQPHNTLHVLIGGRYGDMSYQNRAAFDPIFWVHHANVDRLWASWQRVHPDAKMSSTAAATLLKFPKGEVFKAQDTLVAAEYDRYDGPVHIAPLAFASPMETPAPKKKLRVHVQSPLTQLVHVTVKGKKIGHVAIFGGSEQDVVAHLATKEEDHSGHDHSEHMHSANGEAQTFDVSHLGDFDEKDVDIVQTFKDVPKPNFSVTIR